jgi:hypothetical protein
LSVGVGKVNDYWTVVLVKKCSDNFYFDLVLKVKN